MGNTNKIKSSDEIHLAADGAQSMVSALSGLRLNASNSSISATDNSNNSNIISIPYPESSEELDILPLELWNEILLLVEDQTLANTVPRISRLLYHFTSEDSDIWRRKCEAKSKNEEKPESTSWKKFYYTSQIRLFPLYDITIGKTTHDQMSAKHGAVACTSGSSRYIEYNKINFWVHRETNLFTSMYICQGIYIIPAEWEEKGLTWDKSFYEYKEWCKKSFGNYKVTEAPHETEFQNKMCFTASLETVVREAHDVLYLIKLDFNFTPGDVYTCDTLYSISLSSYNDMDAQKEEFNQRYDERKCDDGEAQIE